MAILEDNKEVTGFLRLLLILFHMYQLTLQSQSSRLRLRTISTQHTEENSLQLAGYSRQPDLLIMGYLHHSDESIRSDIRTDLAQTAVKIQPVGTSL